MPVTDLQAWADNAEAIRLPAIEADIDQLQTDQLATSSLLSAKSQEFTDAIAANVVAITVAQQTADNADTVALDASTRVYASELNARVYTDAEIAALRAEFLASQTALQAQVEANLTAYLDGEIAGISPGLQAAIDQKLAEIQALKAALDLDIIDIQTVNDSIINNSLPVLNAATTQLQTDVNATNTELTNLKAGTTYLSIGEEVDAIRAENEANLNVIGNAILEEPRALWTGSSILAHTELVKPSVPVSTGSFVTNDAEFKNAFEFSQGLNQTIGPAAPIDFDPTHIYKIEVMYRCVDNGSGSGAVVFIGATSQKGTTLLDANYQNTNDNFANHYFTIADGVVTQFAYVTLDNQAVLDYGIDASDIIVLPGTSGTANKLYIHVRQNASNLTTGRIAVHAIKVIDVTESVLSISLSETRLTAQYQGYVTATLDNNYYTIAQADQAIANQVTNLTADLETDVNNLESNLSLNYYTKTQTDGEIDSSVSSAITALNSSIQGDIGAIESDLATNYYTKTEADGEISSAVSGVNTTLTSRILNGTVLGVSSFDAGAEFWTQTDVGKNPPAIDANRLIDVSNLGVVAQLTGFQFVQHRSYEKVTPGRVYELEARVRVTVNSTVTGGTREQVMMQVRLMDETGAGSGYGTLVAEPGYEANKNPIRVSDGWVTLRGRYTMPSSGGHYYWRSRLYYGWDNSGTYGNGTIQVEYFKVTDVTGASEVSAELTTNYYTKTAADSAIAAETLALKTEMESPSGSVGSLESNLTNNYFTKTEVNNTISASVTSYESEVTGIVGRLLPVNFEQDGKYWTSNYNSDPDDTTERVAAGVYSYIDDGGARCLRFIADGGSNTGFGPKGVQGTQNGRTYRVTVEIKQTVGPLSTADGVRMYLRRHNSTYSAYASWATQNVSMSALNTWETHSFEVTDANYTYKNFRPLLYFVQSGILSVGATFVVRSFTITDITSEKAGEAYALAAGISETNATQAANDANDYRAVAEFSRDVAARVSGGSEVENSLFIEPSSNPTANPTGFSMLGGSGSSIARIATGNKYGNGPCIEYTTGSTLSASLPYIIHNLTNSAGHAADKVEYVLIDFEVEQISGASWGSAHILVNWRGSSYTTEKIYLKDVINGQDNLVQRVRGLVERPSTFVAGGSNDLRIIFYGNENGNTTQGEVNHTARIHRFDCEVVSASSSAFLSQSAVADLKGNAAASFVMRAKAGAALGSVEIIAAESARDGGASASKVILSADEIELDGDATIFSGNEIKSNGFVAGSTGWRIKNNGDAEFNSLIDRSDLVDEAVSYGRYSGNVSGRIVGSDSTLTAVSINLGQVRYTDHWKICFVGEHRGDAGGIRSTQLSWRMRTHNGTTWSAWTTLSASSGNGSNTWEPKYYFYNFIGNHEDVEFEIRVSSNAPAAQWSQTNIRRTHLIARSQPSR